MTSGDREQAFLLGAYLGQKCCVMMSAYVQIKFPPFVSFNNPWDFPGGAVVKNPPANAGDTGLISGLGRSHMPRSN